MQKIYWLVLVIMLGACSSGPTPPGLNISNVCLISDEKLNLNSALTVDFVVVYDKALLTKLQGMTATQYFSSIDQLRRDNMSMADIWRWELVPGQLLENYRPVYENKKVWGGLIFADYQTPGDHRIGLGTSDTVCITFGEKDIDTITTEQVPEGSEELVIYPVGETVILNTRTPTTGITSQSYDEMKKNGGEKYPAQNQKTTPAATVEG